MGFIPVGPSLTATGRRAHPHLSFRRERPSFARPLAAEQGSRGGRRVAFSDRPTGINPVDAFGGSNSFQVSQDYEMSFRANAADFVWTEDLPDADALGRRRMTAMTNFLADYEAGRPGRRYVAAELPSLPFADGQFDLALTSHFLFLYSAQRSEDFHVESIQELCRVAREARIFPLLELGGKPSRHLDAVLGRLDALNYGIEMPLVNYEFLRGANRMLRVWRR